MNRIQRGVATAAGAAAVALAGQLPAQAIHDVTPPGLHTPVKAHFIVGSQLDEFEAGDGVHFYNIPQRIAWSGSDDSGFVYYQVWNHLAGDDPVMLEETLDTSIDVASSDYDSQFGGGSFATTNWSVRALDASGNVTAHAVYGAHLTVTQDNGSQTPEHETDDVSIAYTGDWTLARCGCFASGTTHKTTQAGARVVARVDVSADEESRAVALVMETAANRGRARILVDGVRQGVVDTQAATATHQVVVWETVLAPGSHRVAVVNLATPGRPRIDLDAVVVN